jgi:hypothetical protein
MVEDAHMLGARCGGPYRVAIKSKRPLISLALLRTRVSQANVTIFALIFVVYFRGAF